MPRPKGAPNKVTRDLREFVQSFLEDNADRIQEDFDSLSPAERLRFLERLFPFVMPKYTSVTIQDETDKEPVGLPSWFDEV
jgi:hypothetical protein